MHYCKIKWYERISDIYTYNVVCPCSPAPSTLSQSILHIPPFPNERIITSKFSIKENQKGFLHTHLYFLLNSSSLGFQIQILKKEKSK